MFAFNPQLLSISSNPTSGCDGKDGLISFALPQVSTQRTTNGRFPRSFFYCICEIAEEVSSSMNISNLEDNRQKYIVNSVISISTDSSKFEKCHFRKSFCKSQKTDKTIDEFITGLHNLLENCSFGNFKEEMIRDRIMVGILDQSQSERLHRHGPNLRKGHHYVTPFIIPFVRYFFVSCLLASVVLQNIFKNR